MIVCAKCCISNGVYNVIVSKYKLKVEILERDVGLYFESIKSASKFRAKLESLVSMKGTFHELASFWANISYLLWVSYLDHWFQLKL